MQMFEHGDSEQRRDLAKKLAGHVLTLSLQIYGCRVFQKVIFDCFCGNIYLLQHNDLDSIDESCHPNMLLNTSIVARLVRLFLPFMWRKLCAVSDLHQVIGLF